MHTLLQSIKHFAAREYYKFKARRTNDLTKINEYWSLAMEANTRLVRTGNLD